MMRIDDMTKTIFANFMMRKFMMTSDRDNCGDAGGDADDVQPSNLRSFGGVLQTKWFIPFTGAACVPSGPLQPLIQT